MTRNHRQSGSGRLRWLAVPLLSTAMLLALAGPATAAETLEGSGAGVGYSNINVTGDPNEPLCLHVPAGQTYVIDVAEGSVTAAETTPTTNAAEYAGPLTITITLTEEHYINPLGTFDESTCSGTQDSIDASISVSGSLLDSSVDCPSDTGNWTRVNTTVTFDELGKDGDGSCTVTSVGRLTQVEVSPVTHAFVGNEYPCFNDPITSTSTCPDPADDVHVQGDWTAVAANA